MKEAPLVNRIAKSKLITINPETYYPRNIYDFDLKPFLFHGLMLREKEFRQSMTDFDWASLAGQIVHVHCSSDAIIPRWAYMLVAAKAAPHAAKVYSGDEKEAFISSMIMDGIKKAYPADTIDSGKYVIKGCADVAISEEVYSATTLYLVSHGATSVMFGEPCSTVPIYKKPKPKG